MRGFPIGSVNGPVGLSAVSTPIPPPELAKYRKKHKNDFTLQRYKGLGEMDPEQLWETTLDPARRYMKQVQIEDAIHASEITELLMGSEVPPRKSFIHDHAGDAELDI